MKKWGYTIKSSRAGQQNNLFIFQPDFDIETYLAQKYNKTIHANCNGGQNLPILLVGIGLRYLKI